MVKENELAKSIRKILMGHIPIDIKVQQIYKQFKTIDDVKEILPTLFIGEQVMLVKLLCDKKTGKFKFEESEVFFNWALKWQKELLYMTLFDKIQAKFEGIKRKSWWRLKLKLLYWKIRYRSKWKYIKILSKWNNPIFMEIKK